MKEVFFSDYLREKGEKEPCGLRCLGRGRPDPSTRRNCHRRRLHRCIRCGRHRGRPFRRGHARSHLVDLPVRNPGRAGPPGPSSLVGIGRRLHRLLQPPFERQRKASDIDCILVGPSGLFVFEVKHHHGLILYRNRIWSGLKWADRELLCLYIYRNGVWARIKVGRRGTLYRGQLGDPSGQLYRNIRRLKELLGKHRRPLASRRRRLHEPAGHPRHRRTPMGQGHSREGPGADPFQKNGPFRRADRRDQRPPRRFSQEVISEWDKPRELHGHVRNIFIRRFAEQRNRPGREHGFSVAGIRDTQKLRT